MLDFLALTARMLVGGVLAAAGLAKAAGLDDLTRQVRRFPIARVLAAKTSPKLVAVALVAVEIAIGLSLLLGFRTAYAAFAAACLFGAFTTGIAMSLREGDRRPCGCFSRSSTHTLGVPALLRSIALLALAAIAGRPAGPSLDTSLAGTSSPEATALLAGTAVALAALAATFMARPPWLAVAGIGRVVHTRPSKPAKRSALTDLLRGIFRARARNENGSARRRGDDDASVPLEAPKSFRTLQRALRENAADAGATLTRLETLLEERWLQDLQDNPLTDEEQSRWQRAERELADVEERANAYLAEMFEDALKRPEMQAEALAVRAGLSLWTVLLRRRLMRPMHTLVPGLDDDPRCDGDVLADALFDDYFEALFAESERDGRVRAIRALAALARQSACLGAQQSAHLASALYWSFADLLAFLRLNGMDRIAAAIAQAGSAPLLLFYDVEKYRGPGAPLARWFRENEEAILDGVRTKRIPSSWHGLWLYDRATGHLLGYRPVEKDRDENEVRLDVWFESITRPENLGRFDCGFTEMIERGSGLAGYLCAGSPCADQQAGGASPGTQPSRTRSLGASLTTIEESVTASLCGDGPSGGGGGGGGGGPCGPETAGRSRASRAVACVAEASMSATDRLFRCMAEATGRCSDPVDRFTKQLSERTFRGVPLGSQCGRMAGAGDGGVTDDKWLEEWRKNLEKKLDDFDAEKWIQDGIDRAQKEWEAARDKADKAQDDALKALKALEDAEKARASQAEIDAAKQKMKDAIDAMEKADKEEKKKREELEKKKGNEKPQGAKCPPDTPNCGGNDCTGMSEWMRQTLSCTEKYMDELDGDDDTFTRDPGWVDPSPLDDSGDPSWTRCLEGIDSVNPSTASRQCWAIRCTNGATTLTPGGSACGCAPAVEGGIGAGGLSQTCDNIMCAEGQTPVFKNGHCTCGGGGFGGGGGGGPRPPGPMQLPGVPSFGGVRAGEMEMIGMSPDR